MGIFSRSHQPSTPRHDEQVSWEGHEDHAPGRFSVEDVFVITGRGPVFTGTMVSGTLQVEDPVVFESANPELKALSGIITSVESRHRKSKSLRTGDTGGIFIKDIRVEHLPHTASSSGFVLDSRSIAGSIIRHAQA